MQQLPFLQSPTTLDDTDLVARLRRPATRNAALREVTVHYGPRLRAHIQRMVTSREDTDDVLQLTLIKIYRGVDKFAGRSSFYTWIYRIATNESLTWLEKRRRRTSFSLEDEANWVDRELRAADYFDGDAAQRKLQAAVAGLPDRQRAVFQLRYYDEMPYRQMAEIFDLTEGALKASYHHAAQKVSAYLTDHSDEIA
ncbi:MAG: sigma-70 family RNA polymerase sigma factor [Saprospiraceae bacterium]